jgi:hypothetical protein
MLAIDHPEILSAYRIDGRSRSVADEYGDHAYTGYGAILRTLDIVRRTPCGMWIREKLGHKRFVLQTARKQYAHLTKELALEAYLARSNRLIGIYQARIIGIQKQQYHAHKLVHPYGGPIIGHPN